MSIRKVLLSPDHHIFAYNTETEGMEYGDLHLKDLRKETQGEQVTMKVVLVDLSTYILKKE